MSEPRGTRVPGIHDETTVDELNEKRNYVEFRPPRIVRKEGQWLILCTRKNGFGEGKYVIQRAGVRLTGEYGSLMAATRAFESMTRGAT